ncbi:hypothetical protein TWF506_005755 [Arthrobotrys conoides]|uniref:Elongation factor 1 beta central acidic region eukaryote domain-containing protein n=1 Tax=Arthrobotrys conoides TaxID=74498 RepID=A0AAN8RW70_9PEZI
MIEPAAAAEEEDDDEVDLFGSDDEVDEEAEKLKAQSTSVFSPGHLRYFTFLEVVHGE